MVVKWCGTCAHKGACDNARYMECTSAPFKLWTPVATCNNCAKCLEKDMFGVCRILECTRTDRATRHDGYCAWAERRESDGVL